MKKVFKSKEFSIAVSKAMFTRIGNENRKIGVREFAKEIGISPATLSRVVNSRLPDIETFCKLCKWMNVSSELFLNK